MSPCASARTLRDGIQISEALTGDGVTIFRHGRWMDLEALSRSALGRAK